jgi:hypothetical protein
MCRTISRYADIAAQGQGAPPPIMNPCCRSIRETFQRHDAIAGCAPHVGLVEVTKGQIMPHWGVGNMHFTDRTALQITLCIVSGHEDTLVM